MAKKILDPIHPGEVLLKEFLEPMGLSQYRLEELLPVLTRAAASRVISKDAKRGSGPANFEALPHRTLTAEIDVRCHLHNVR